jgi:hypothetical protein
VSYEELERREEIEATCHCWHCRELLRERMQSSKWSKRAMGIALAALAAGAGALASTIAARFGRLPDSPPPPNHAEIYAPQRVEPPQGQHAP